MPAMLDTFPYPWPEPAARELHIVLTQHNASPQQALQVAERAGIPPWKLNAGQATILLWHDILNEAAIAGLTRELVSVALELMASGSPGRSTLEDLLADKSPPLSAEPRRLDGTPVFLDGDDTVSEDEALLYRDDLTLQIGRVPALIETLRRLVKLAPSVCKLEVDVHGRTMYGSGFRIANDLILTNWHVLHLRDDGMRATAVNAEFGYEDDGEGGALTATPTACDVDSIVADKADDWAVIHAKQALRDEWPVVPLSGAGKPATGDSAFIIQHPNGGRKRLGFVRNQVSSVTERYLYYLTDTQSGSSGSPVFNAEGRLIGLHHVGGTPQQVAGKPPLSKNEGVLISRVLAGLKTHNIVLP